MGAVCAAVFPLDPRRDFAIGAGAGVSGPACQPPGGDAHGTDAVWLEQGLCSGAGVAVGDGAAHRLAADGGAAGGLGPWLPWPGFSAAAAAVVSGVAADAARRGGAGAGANAAGICGGRPRDCPRHGRARFRGIASVAGGGGECVAEGASGRAARRIPGGVWRRGPAGAGRARGRYVLPARCGRWPACWSLP